MVLQSFHPHKSFLSTLSLRRATWRFYAFPLFSFYFYPRSPCGERRYVISVMICILLFLSTLSLRRATCRVEPFHAASRFYFYPRSPCGERLITAPWLFPTTYFYPRSPCGERPGGYGCAYLYLIISIHALLAESDVVGASEGAAIGYISIHALLAESDAISQLQCILGRKYFYPRSPCGERQRIEF